MCAVVAEVQQGRAEKHAGEKGRGSNRAMAPKLPLDDTVLNVFQPGLRQGSERLPFDPRKAYFYVEHPDEGWRVYLRSACFVHEAFTPFQADRFLVVKRTGGDPEKKSWEPPKGQMEGRDAGRGKPKSVLQLLKANIRREVAEEAKVEGLRGLHHTGIVLQAIEPDFPPNTYFQYHVFQAFAPAATIDAAMDLFTWFSEHPEAFRRLRPDQQEKDGLGWYNEGTKKLMSRWSPTIVRRYLERMLVPQGDAGKGESTRPHQSKKM